MKIHPRPPSADLAAELEDAAARKGVSESEVLREAVKGFLRRGAGAPADRPRADGAQPEAEPGPLPQGPPLDLGDDLADGAEDGTEDSPDASASPEHPRAGG